MHHADQLLTLVAGVSFILSYIAGLVAGIKFPGKALVLGSVAATVALFVLRTGSAPLSFGAIFAVAAIHLCVGYLTTRILRSTRPI
jgi:hypothetical protein